MLIFFLPVLLVQAVTADERQNHGVATDNDDYTYHIPTINLLYGKGYSESINLPIETYHLNLNSQNGQWIAEEYERNAGKPFIINTRFTTFAEASFYRAPGLPVLLSMIYSVFGPTPLVARVLMAVLVWLTALLLLLLGTYLAGSVGAVAGGVAALIYINLYGLVIFGLEAILTEIPATFWVTLFCVVFSVFLKQRHLFFLILSALALIATIYTRANFVIVVPLFVIYLALTSRRLKESLLFSTVVLIPIIFWATYASVNAGRFIALTTQGEIVFPECNNIDVLEGVGPDRVYQGVWNPGWLFDEHGNLIRDKHNAVRPGENGWAKGLAFWRDNLLELPRLFFVKLQAGFWSQLWYLPASIGICFLLIALGLRVPKNKPVFLPHLRSQHFLMIQLFLMLVFIIIWDNSLFMMVLLIYGLMLGIAVVRPYGDCYQLSFPSPVFFLAFVASHFTTTLLFVGPRYHEPLDVVLIFLAGLGSLTSLQTLYMRAITKPDVTMSAQPEIVLEAV